MFLRIFIIIFLLWTEISTSCIPKRVGVIFDMFLIEITIYDVCMDRRFSNLSLLFQSKLILDFFHPMFQEPFEMRRVKILSKGESQHANEVIVLDPEENSSKTYEKWPLDLRLGSCKNNSWDDSQGRNIHQESTNDQISTKLSLSLASSWSGEQSLCNVKQTKDFFQTSKR